MTTVKPNENVRREGIACKVRFKKNPLYTANVYEFFVAREPTKPRADIIFIPLSPKQLEAVKKLRADQHKNGNRGGIGYSTVRTYPANHSLQWTTFDPMKGNWDIKPVRLGIGTLLHHAITEHLAANYPKHRVHHELVTTRERREHLKAMGINPEQAYKVEEYRDIIRRYIEKRKAQGK
ncbi:MAG: hypothetical protein V1722_04855 [Candidatus Micrarchaeota archaeon]